MAKYPKVLGLYTSRLRDPTRRLVIHLQVGPRLERYEVLAPSTLKEMVLEALSTLTDSDPNFPSRLEQTDAAEYQRNSYRSRRYFATDRNELYPNSSHLTTKYSEKFKNFWLATNIGWNESRAILRMASKAAGVKYGAAGTIRF